MPFRVITVQEGAGAMSLADERQLPGEVECILDTAVHSVALERSTDVGRIPREQDTTCAESLRDLCVAVKARWIGDVLEANLGQVTKDGGRGVTHQVGVRGTRSQV